MKTKINVNKPGYIKELIGIWPDFFSKPYYYVDEYLPRIISNPNKCSDRERLLIELINDSPNLRSLLLQEYVAYINKAHLMAVKGILNNYDFKGADEYYQQNKDHLPDYASLRADAKTKYQALKTSEIHEALEEYKFELAEQLYLLVKDIYPREKFDCDLEFFKGKRAKEEEAAWIGRGIQEITSLLANYEFARASEKYAQLQTYYSVENYQDLVKIYKRRQEKEYLLSTIKENLEAGNFIICDNLFLKSDLISEEEYLILKAPYIKKFVLNNYRTEINLEKAKALSNPCKNMLLSARAGSGKTTVLACKASLLIDTENVHPDQILVMAFNTTAAKEIRNRIRREFKQPAYDNARTFHSLASQLVQPEEDILFDDKEDLSTRKLTLFIQQILKTEIKNPAFIEIMYKFFRKEMREIERAGFLLDDESYFDYRRNILQVTLGGEKVKSIGEKIIADYLFEHDISYGYEKVWLWGSQIYRPDFSIFYQQKDYVIEHWGIDEFDPNKKVPEGWTLTWNEYYAQMLAKRSFLKEKSAFLIETSVRDLRGGREAFEAIIEKRLAEKGILRLKLSKLELLQKIKDRDYTLTHMAELFGQFIQKAKKQMLTAAEMQILSLSYRPKEEREAVFIDLACRVYLEYEQALVRKRKIDYDDLLKLAIEKIHATKSECAIWLGTPKNRSIKMNELRWILIDEYQDFSSLFFELVAAIRKYNPAIRLYCVGDDWQAINGFAGSDLQYFTGFTQWIENSSVEHLVTNFRSRAEIVHHSNTLMQGKGTPGKALADKPGGTVNIEWVDDRQNWVELRIDDANASLKAKHERFVITEVSAKENGKQQNRILASKYLKRCYEIITDSENDGKSIAILNRTNRIDGVRLDEFKKRLIACFSPQELKKIGDPIKKIHIQTAHKYKGLQADMVIILNVTDGAFPLLHPDNALFEIFGKTLLDAFEEERRLFYVALTRAKFRLYILTEKGRESVFLKCLPAYKSRPSNHTWSSRQSQNANQYTSEEIPF